MIFLKTFPVFHLTFYKNGSKVAWIKTDFKDNSAPMYKHVLSIVMPKKTLRKIKAAGPINLLWHIENEKKIMFKK